MKYILSILKSKKNLFFSEKTASFQNFFPASKVFYIYNKLLSCEKLGAEK
jgi:hypothetical protein